MECLVSKGDFGVEARAQKLTLRSAGTARARISRERAISTGFDGLPNIICYI
ncbi:MAG: hypothetical protein Q9207_003526 [Kuettlingeria erythrocarpa]